MKVAHYRSQNKNKDKKQTAEKAADLDLKQHETNNIGTTQTEQDGGGGGGGGDECTLTIDDLPNDALVHIFTRFPLENLNALEKGT